MDHLLDAFEQSGTRRGEFCRKHDVAVGTLDFWRKRRRLERGLVANNHPAARNVDVRSRAASNSRLVAVELVGLPEGPGSKAVGGGLAVVVSRGRKIEVSRGFDAVTLERLLDVLEQG